MARLRQLLVLALAAAGYAAAAEKPSTPKDSAVIHPMVTSAMEEKRVRDYWTSERIASINRDPSASHPLPIPIDQRYHGAEFESQGAIKKTVGRLLYTSTMPDGSGSDSSCTATLLKSKNEATLVTAGHCSSAGTNTASFIGYNKNLLWIPGFRDGKAPYGNFTVHKVITSRLYEEDEDALIGNDRSFLVLNLDAQGRAAGKTLGPGQSIKFGKAPSGYRQVLGYPRYVASGPDSLPQRGIPAFTGQRVASCNGTSIKWQYGHGLTGIPCLMGGGASGGPSLANLDISTGLGTIVAVNSINDVVVEGKERIEYLWGTPVTDKTSEMLYNAAQAVKPSFN